MIAAPEALVAHCRKPVRAAAISRVGQYDFSDAKALYQWIGENQAIGSDDDWRTAGMAARLEFGDAGLELWQATAAAQWNESLDEKSLTRWRSFDTEPTPNCATINSVFDIAHKAGWKGTVRPSLAAMFNVADMIDSSAAAPAPPLPDGVPGPSDPGAEARAADELAHPTPPGGFVKTLAQSLAGFVPPDYLVDGILQRRFCYSLTAQTGVGKTTAAMRLAAHVATGKSLGDIQIERGTVVYFAGENPTDVQMRWLGLCKEMNLDPTTLDVHVVEGSMHLSKVAERITQEVNAHSLSVSLVVVDTAAAYFEEDNDNDNVQAGNHARRLRALCALPGGPCVLVLCHPTKNAQDDQLVPRGGGAFLNEVDGNIALRRNGDTITAFALGKFRGPEFIPINFALKVVRDHPLLKDTKGRQIPTIVAVPISAAEVERVEITVKANERKILEALCNSTGMRQTDIAKVIGSNHSIVSRAIPGLIAKKLVEESLGVLSATPKAQKALNAVANAAVVQPEPKLTPMVLGDAPFPTPARPVTAPPMPPPY